MGVIDVSGRQKRMQESFDRLTRTVEERRAAREVLDHLLICHRVAVSQWQDLRQPQGRKSGLRDRSHVSAGAFDPEQFDGAPEMIGVHQFGAGVAPEGVHHAAVSGQEGGAVDEAIESRLACCRRLVPQVTGHAARYSLPPYAGGHPPPRCATRSLVRSAAMVYWVRSFVQMEKKSVSRANWSASTAADGTSTIMPTCRRGATGWPADVTSRLARSSSALAARSSSIEAIIGTMIRRSWSRLARSRAPSCTAQSSGRCRLIRTARQPRNGFASLGRSR